MKIRWRFRVLAVARCGDYPAVVATGSLPVVTSWISENEGRLEIDASTCWRATRGLIRSVERARGSVELRMRLEEHSLLEGSYDLWSWLLVRLTVSV